MSTRRTLDRALGDVGDLIARHEDARGLDEFARYADDPVGFIREVLGGSPWERQVEIAEAVRDSPLTVVRSCNSAGKDWVAARLALWWSLCRRGLALVTGPTERQVREVVMGEVTRAFRAADGLPGDLYASALRLGNEEEAGILAFTSTEASRLTGFHAPRVLGVLTEAQGVEAFAWEGLLSCAVGAEDRILAVGNPLEPSGRFYRSSRSKGWTSLRIPASEHPNVVQGETVVSGGVTRAFIRRMAREYGEGSAVYRARVEGEFPESADAGLYSRGWLEAAADRWDSGDLKFRADGTAPLVAVDPARFGPDATAVAVRRGPVLEKLETWAGATSTTEIAERLGPLLEEVGVRRFGHREGVHGAVVVDSVGVGAGLADRLAEEGWPVVEHVGGEGSGDPARFLNRRAESYWQLRRLLEAGEIALPRDADLFDELLAIRWSPTPSGQVRVEPKEALRGRIGRSPDRADAVVMAFASEGRVEAVEVWHDGFIW